MTIPSSSGSSKLSHTKTQPISYSYAHKQLLIILYQCMGLHDMTTYGHVCESNQNIFIYIFIASIVAYKRKFKYNQSNWALVYINCIHSIFKILKHILTSFMQLFVLRPREFIQRVHSTPCSLIFQEKNFKRINITWNENLALLTSHQYEIYYMCILAYELRGIEIWRWHHPSIIISP